MPGLTVIIGFGAGGSSNVSKELPGNGSPLVMYGCGIPEVLEPKRGEKASDSGGP